MEHNIVYISFGKWDQENFIMFPIALKFRNVICNKNLFYTLGFSEVNDNILVCIEIPDKN